MIKNPDNTKNTRANRWGGSQKPSLKARAIRYLARKEYTRQTLGKRLLPYAEAEDNLEALLDWLEQQGFLSDERYVQAQIRSRATRYGSSRMLYELEGHGVSEAILTQARSSLADTEQDRAYAVWQKKFGVLPEDNAARGKQMRFMQQRGFSISLVQQIWKRVASQHLT